MLSSGMKEKKKRNGNAFARLWKNQHPVRGNKLDFSIKLYIHLGSTNTAINTCTAFCSSKCYLVWHQLNTALHIAQCIVFLLDVRVKNFSFPYSTTNKIAQKTCLRSGSCSGWQCFHRCRQACGHSGQVMLHHTLQNNSGRDTKDWWNLDNFMSPNVSCIHCYLPGGVSCLCVSYVPCKSLCLHGYHFF